jgi:putative hemolysin
MTPLLLFLLGVATVYLGAIETAFSALMRLSLRLMAERSGHTDRLGKYLDDPILLFVPVRLLLGVIFALATVAMATLIGPSTGRRLGLLLLAVALFILVCEHLLPMLIVRRDPERILGVLLLPFDVVVRFLQPMTRTLVGLIGESRRERVGALLPGPSGEEEQGEVAHAYLEAGEEQGVLETEERRLLQSVVDFGDTLAREVMTPRPDIVAIRSDATIDQLRALFREQEYSRFPVYVENLDNILGFVFVKDLIQLPDDVDGSESLTRLVRPATVVPETKRVLELLKEFQRKQVQIAVVVDEYGGTAGMVTIEDLLEEIVGEIRDEYDVETEPIVDEGRGSFLFSAKVNVAEVAERLGVQIEPEGFETLGGYLLTHLGRVPAVGEAFSIDSLEVEVLEAERRRIHKVRVRRAEPVPQPQT